MSSKSKVILAFVTLFIVGMASGYFLNEVISPKEKEVIEQRMDRGERTFRGEGQRGRFDGNRQQRVQSRISGHLNLREDQEELFFDELESYRMNIREKIKEARDHEGEMIRELYYEFREELSEILTEDQLQRLDSTVHPDSARRGGRFMIRPGGSK